MFCSFKHCIPALTFKHCSGFSCPNISVFIFSFVTLCYRKYNPVWKLLFRSRGKTPRRSRFLICFRFHNHLWEISSDQDILWSPGNSPNDNHSSVTVPQALGCMHLPFSMSSRHVPHVSICRYFEASPFCSQVHCKKKNKLTNDSPAKPWKWTTHTWAFFCSFEVIVPVSMLFLFSRSHVFRLLSSA